MLFLAMPPGTLGSQRDVLSIPVEVSLGDDIRPAKKAQAAELPQRIPDLLFAVLVPYLGPRAAAEETRRAAAASSR